MLDSSGFLRDTKKVCSAIRLGSCIPSGEAVTFWGLLMRVQSLSGLLSISLLVVASVLVSGCGGQKADRETELQVLGAPPAAPLPSAIYSIAGPRQNYVVSKISVGYLVTDVVGAQGSTTIKGMQALQFNDVRVNLLIGDLAQSMAVNDLNRIIDLYIAFFNRVPDADGLAYWIERSKSGAGIDQIADSFYDAALFYSGQTGYAKGQSNQEFVKLIYKNVLGRSGTNAPSDAETQYWSAQLDSGVRRGTLVQTMLNSARSFYADPTWNWVPRLLDNKVKVGRIFAIEQGLNYLSPQESILRTMAIASAVEQNSTLQAERLIPVSNLSTSLAGEPNYDNLKSVCKPAAEQSWARAHLDDVYLWYKEIVDVPVSTTTPVESHFASLLVKTKDRFSFVTSQAEVDGYFDTGAGIGYGYSLLRQGTRLRVLYVQPGSPAELAGLQRGASIAQIDGTSLAQPANDIQYAALYPSTVQTHTFDILDPGKDVTRRVLMTSSKITQVPVLTSKVIATAKGKIGYMVFNEHIRTAEQALIDVVNNFKQEQITDLVLDMRYNGGGYLYIANELGAMIGGSKTSGQLFEQLQYNDKHIRESALGMTWFYGYDTLARTLPWLNLNRVFILTGSRTCSASESVINSLSPFLQVILIGENTCGKPYGFLQTNNCSKAYFAIRFSGTNALGQGDYVNGFAPQCSVADDLEHNLGDVSESRLAAALKYSETGVCPVIQGMGLAAPPQATGERDPYPWRSIRILQ